MWALVLELAWGSPAERAVQLAQQSKDWPAECVLAGNAPTPHRWVFEAEIDGTPGREHIVTGTGGCFGGSQTGIQRVFVVDGDQATLVADPYGTPMRDEATFAADMDGDGRDELISPMDAEIWSLKGGRFVERTRPTSRGQGVMVGRELFLLDGARAERLLLDPASGLWRPGPAPTEQELQQALAARLPNLCTDCRPELDALGILALARQWKPPPVQFPPPCDLRPMRNAMPPNQPWFGSRLVITAWADPHRAETWASLSGEDVAQVRASLAWALSPPEPRPAVPQPRGEVPLSEEAKAATVPSLLKTLGETPCDQMGWKASALLAHGASPEEAVQFTSAHCPQDEDEMRRSLLVNSHATGPALPREWVLAQLEHPSLRVRRAALWLLTAKR